MRIVQFRIMFVILYSYFQFQDFPFQVHIVLKPELNLILYYAFLQFSAKGTDATRIGYRTRTELTVGHQRQERRNVGRSTTALGAQQFRMLGSPGATFQENQVRVGISWLGNPNSRPMESS
jgi:hypothetical protein